ncbi:MAG: PH domain-containing protein [Egibacteraceae bacterium]
MDSVTDPGEMPRAALSPLDPRVRTLWWISGGVVAGIATLVALGVDVVFSPLGPPGFLTVLVALGAGAVATVLPVLRYRTWRYALRPRDLWIQHGAIRVTISVIPYQRLQFVDTEQGPVGRRLGLAELVVHTAAPGTSGRLPGLEAAEAEQLRERLALVQRDVDGI